MVDKFQNKYRIPSARAAWWDYGNDAAYFITICTANRIHHFCEIHNGEIVLSEIGKITLQCWNEIPNQFPFAKLDVFVVMPNHVHGILTINRGSAVDDRDAINRVSTNNNIGGITGCNNPMLSENVSTIIRWYKGRTTFFSRKINANFAWQTRFWDHIIRDDDAYFRIKTYIENNPKHWHDDRLHSNTNGKQ